MILDLKFSIPEIIALVGGAQCIYILVYMLFRAGKGDRVLIPLLYFSVLGIALFLEFSRNYIGDISPHYEDVVLLFWFYGPPLSFLLIVQVLQITKPPSYYDFSVVLFIPLSLIAAYALSEPGTFSQWLVIFGLISGALSLLMTWVKKPSLSQDGFGASARARYWLVLSLVAMNLSFLALMIVSLSDALSRSNVMLIRSLIGLGFIYLATTSLFRIFPQAVRMHDAKGKGDRTKLSDRELEIAFKIEGFLRYEKVYQEPGYSRADLARDCKVSEAVLSKIINVYFEKTFPQLMNERRVEDAKRLLKETTEPMRVIALESGFNSLPSFNRVFKEITGKTASSFRK